LALARGRSSDGVQNVGGVEQRGGELTGFHRRQLGVKGVRPDHDEALDAAVDMLHTLDGDTYPGGVVTRPRQAPMNVLEELRQVAPIASDGTGRSCWLEMVAAVVIE
jgi:hypothetical protein